MWRNPLRSLRHIGLPAGLSARRCADFAHQPFDEIAGGGDRGIMLGLHTPPATPSSGQPVIGKRDSAVFSRQFGKNLLTLHS